MVKKILRWLLFIFLAVLLIGAVLIWKNYYPDIPLTELKSKYEKEHSQYMSINGMDVHYTIDGKGADTLLLLHGTASSLHTWDKWVALLKDSFTIVRLDLPAFGLTGPHPENDYSAEAYIKVLDHFVNELNMTEFLIGGNSFGGYLAWQYTWRNPGKIRKMALLNASGYKDESGAKKQPLAFRLGRIKWLSPWLEKITPEPMIRKAVQKVYVDQSKVEEEAIFRYFELLRRPGNRKAAMLKLQEDYTGYEDKIKKIKCPSLVVWGDTDVLVDVKFAYRFHEDLPNSELKVYKNVGHVPMEEIPVESARLTMEFLMK